MLDFGWAELLIIVAVAVFVIGPKDIPKMMYGMGRVMRRFQYVRFAVTKQFDDMMQAGDLEELRKGTTNGVNFEENRRALNAESNEEKPQNEIDAEYDEAEFDEEYEEGNDVTCATYKKISSQYADCFNEPSDHIDDFLKLLPEKAVILDAGCGPGVDAYYMSQKNHLVHGIDYAQDMIELAQRKYPEIEFEVCDLKHINYEAHKFDGVLASYSLIHIEKKFFDEAIKKISNVLKKDGIFCIGFQEGDSAEIMINEPLDESLKIFLNVMSEDEITNVLEKNGFKVIKKFSRPFESKDELPFNKVCLIARKDEVKND